MFLRCNRCKTNVQCNVNIGNCIRRCHQIEKNTKQAEIHTHKVIPRQSQSHRDRICMIACVGYFNTICSICFPIIWYIMSFCTLSKPIRACKVLKQSDINGIITCDKDQCLIPKQIITIQTNVHCHQDQKIKQQKNIHNIYIYKILIHL